MMIKLIPFLNLDPDKKYTSIKVTAELRGNAIIEATTLASEKRE